MKINNAKVICKSVSKKGSELISLFQSNDRLVDNCVLVNPCGLSINIDSSVSGDMIFNSNGLNTFILTAINK